jgi:hypothetical protein
MAKRVLVEIYAEWRVYEHLKSQDPDDIDPAGGWDDPVYQAALKEAKQLPADALADDVWERASELRTCTNGGHEAWICPYGCLSHMVPFHRSTAFIRRARQRGRLIE